MPSSTSKFEVRTIPGTAPAPPPLGAVPEPTRHAPTVRERTLEPGSRSLVDLSRRSATALTMTLDQLVAVQLELRSIIEIVAERPWSEQERHRYRHLARAERRAHRRSVAARDWFDDVRARLYEESI
jgi:hypothetical protein